MRNVAQKMAQISLAVVLACLSLATAGAQHFLQQGSELTAAVSGVGISADGNTAIIAVHDPLTNTSNNIGPGGALVFVRSNGVWTQEGDKLVGLGAPNDDYDNCGGRISVAISGDGNTALVSRTFDQCEIGAVWVFTRSNGVWTQQGNKITPVGVTPYSECTPLAGGNGCAAFGWTLALSFDGNTGAIGGLGGNGSWIFVRQNGSWSQQSRLNVDGWATSLSADGNTLLVAQPAFPPVASVFARNGTTWALQTQLVPTGSMGYAPDPAASLSSDGLTAIFGNFNDNGGLGAVWVFSRTSNTWHQRGNKLVPNDGVTSASNPLSFGSAVSVSGNGAEVIIAAKNDNGGAGAIWLFVPGTNNGYMQHDAKFFGTGAQSGTGQGTSLAISSDGNTLIDGAQAAAWPFAAPRLAVSKTHKGNFTQGERGAEYTLVVTNAGARTTTSAVDLVDQLPSGLTATGMSGNGWNCTLLTLTCTQTTVLHVGESYPPVTVTVNVAGNAAAIVTNQAIASGGGSNWGIARDPTQISH